MHHQYPLSSINRLLTLDAVVYVGLHPLLLYHDKFEDHNIVQLCNIFVVL